MVSIDQILTKLDHLPAVSVGVTKLITNLCGDEDAPGSESTASIVMRDSALTISVLRAANCASLGFQMPAATINDALSRIGENQLLKIALAHASEAALGGPIEEYGLAKGEAWMGGLAGALAAEGIAKATGSCDPNLAFTAGLLRDIGKLAMGLVVPSADLLEALVGGSANVIERESAAFGFDHAQVGEALGRSWELPEPLLRAIRFHHEPPRGDDADLLIDTVHCADGIAMMLGYGVGFDGLSYSLNQTSCELLKFDRLAVEEQLIETRLRLSDFVAEDTGTATPA